MLGLDPSIRELLVRRLDGDVRVPAKSTVHAVLDRHGLVARARRRRNRAEGTPLSVGAAPNDLWCADYKGEFKLGNGRYSDPSDTADNDPEPAGGTAMGYGSYRSAAEDEENTEPTCTGDCETTASGGSESTGIKRDRFGRYMGNRDGGQGYEETQVAQRGLPPGFNFNRFIKRQPQGPQNPNTHPPAFGAGAAGTQSTTSQAEAKNS